MKTHCIKCKQPFRRLGPDWLRIEPGDCYTDAGWKETQISGYCEYCFDEMFAEDEDEDLYDFDEWASSEVQRYEEDFKFRNVGDDVPF